MRLFILTVIAACVTIAATVDIGYDEGDVTPFSC